MPRIKKITGPGLIVNRHAKKSKIEVSFDPSPEGFITAARREEARLKLLLIPGDGNIDPIEMHVSPMIWVFKFERAQIPPDRLADLEFLITEEKEVHVVLEYTPTGEDLPFEEDEHVGLPGESRREPTPSAEVQRQEIVKGTEFIKVKFSGIKWAVCEVTIIPEEPDGCIVRVVLSIGNYSTGYDQFGCRTQALDTAIIKAKEWLREIPNTGTADQKRAFDRRRGMMTEQIEAQLRAELDGFDSGNEEP